MTNFNYTDFISRNYAYISTELQSMIQTTSLVFAGCGLASVIAEGAARIGFEKFTLYDHDHVELSNLNRQNFNLSNIGYSKVSITKQALLQINPNVDVTTYSQKIGLADIDQVLAQGSILINTIDYGDIYFQLVHRGMEQGKLIICPFNPGLGGLAVCFNNGSGTLFDLLKTDRVETGVEFPKKLRLNNQHQFPSSVIKEFFNLLDEIGDKPFYPQIVIGAYMTSAIVLDSIIKYLNNEAIPLAPSLIYRGLSPSVA